MSVRRAQTHAVEHIGVNWVPRGPEEALPRWSPPNNSSLLGTFVGIRADPIECGLMEKPGRDRFAPWLSFIRLIHRP